MLNALKWAKLIADLLSNPELQAAWKVLLDFLATLSPEKQDEALANLTEAGFCSAEPIDYPEAAIPAIEAIKAQAE
jgi:hypothetical protein